MCCLVSDDDLVRILGQRLYKQASANTEDLLELGECVEILEKKDQSDVATEVKAQKESREVTKEFKVALKHKQASVTGCRKVAMPRAPVKRFKAGDYTQEYLQTVSPPGAHLWKSNSQGNWQMRCPPCPRKSRSWAVAGEPASASYILQEAWRAWLTTNGFPISACPLQGLFEAGDD